MNIGENLENEIGNNPERDFEIWTNLGLLERLDEDKRHLCSELYTKLTKFLLADPRNREPFTLIPEVVLFPIIRRVIQLVDCDPKNIDFGGIIRLFDGHTALDSEAEIVSMICDYFINEAHTECIFEKLENNKDDFELEQKKKCGELNDKAFNLIRHDNIYGDFLFQPSVLIYAVIRKIISKTPIDFDFEKQLFEFFDKNSEMGINIIDAIADYIIANAKNNNENKSTEQ